MPYSVEVPTLDETFARVRADADRHGALEAGGHGCDFACLKCGHCALMFVPICPCLGVNDDGSGEDCGCGEIAAEEWPAALEAVRSVAVRLEQELAALRDALTGLHAPKAVGSSDPEDPTIICQTCREDFPCETRSYLDALDPARVELDEFAAQEPPF